MNAAVEAANKNIKEIVQKMTVTYKDWHEMLPFALHGYRTSAQTSIGGNTLLSGVWHGGGPTHRSPDTVSLDYEGCGFERGRLDPNPA